MDQLIGGAVTQGDGGDQPIWLPAWVYGEREEVGGGVKIIPGKGKFQSYI